MNIQQLEHGDGNRCSRPHAYSSQRKREPQKRLFPLGWPVFVYSFLSVCVLIGFIYRLGINIAAIFHNFLHFALFSRCGSVHSAAFVSSVAEVGLHRVDLNANSAIVHQNVHCIGVFSWFGVCRTALFSTYRSIEQTHGISLCTNMRALRMWQENSIRKLDVVWLDSAIPTCSSNKSTKSITAITHSKWFHNDCTINGPSIELPISFEWL